MRNGVIRMPKKKADEPGIKATAVPIRLNLGSGFRPLEGYINIDSRPEVEPDMVLDIAAEGLSTYGDSTVDEVRAYDFLEHVSPDKVVFVLSEIHRVLKPEGILDSLTPSTDGRGAFQDPTHRSFWNINSWLYFTNRDWQGLYPEFPLFEIVEIGDIFTSSLTRDLKIVHTLAKLRPIK